MLALTAPGRPAAQPPVNHLKVTAAIHAIDLPMDVWRFSPHIRADPVYAAFSPSICCAPQEDQRMNITRQKIISTLHTQLTSHPNILAAWLEGADATGSVDEYSDIDLCCSVEKDSMAEVSDLAQKSLEELGELDLMTVLYSEVDSQHVIFHLAGTSPYLLIDFNVYVGRGSEFNEGDEIEKPLVLFDRGAVIHYTPQNEKEIVSRNRQRIRELQEMIAQSSRIEKYVKRGSFLEAFGYYHRWLLTPLIELLRIRYTPLHTDYYIVHISRHLPSHVLQRLEELFKVTSVADIETKQKDALAFFEEVRAESLES